MGNVATNVSTGKPGISGAIWVGVIGTDTVPTDATTALTGFKCLGYISEDGLENENSKDMAQIKAWGGAIVYRSLTEMTDNFKFAPIEALNVDVLKTIYGSSNVTESSGAISIDVKAENPTEYIWVFEIALRGDKKKRIVVADGAISGMDNIVYKDDEPIAYGLTISAYPDANGSSHKEYIA